MSRRPALFSATFSGRDAVPRLVAHPALFSATFSARDAVPRLVAAAGLLRVSGKGEGSSSDSDDSDSDSPLFDDDETAAPAEKRQRKTEPVLSTFVFQVAEPSPIQRGLIRVNVRAESIFKQYHTADKHAVRVRFVCYVLALCARSLLEVSDEKWNEFTKEHNDAVSAYSESAACGIAGRLECMELNALLLEPDVQLLNQVWGWKSAESGSMLWDCKKIWTSPETWKAATGTDNFHLVEKMLRDFATTETAPVEGEGVFEERMLGIHTLYGFLMERTDPIMRAIEYAA